MLVSRRFNSQAQTSCWQGYGCQLKGRKLLSGGGSGRVLEVEGRQAESGPGHASEAGSQEFPPVLSVGSSVGWSQNSRVRRADEESKSLKVKLQSASWAVEKTHTAQYVLNVLGSFYKQLFLIEMLPLESKGKLNQPFSSNITLQIPVVLCRELWPWPSRPPVLQPDM